MRRLIATGLVWLAAWSAAEARAQITRDVGDVAVIEGTLGNPATAAIFVPQGNDGLPCRGPGGEFLYSVDVENASRLFYQTHPNSYDLLLLFSSFERLLSPSDCRNTAGAFHRFVFHDVQGIGRAPQDNQTAFGTSGGVLKGFVDAGDVDDRLPISLDQLIHEIGHQWLAYPAFDADPGPGVTRSTDLLGRGLGHWSFFLHTEAITSTPFGPEASVLEGNRWEEVGPGQFRTRNGPEYGYSPLDLYLMGLRPPSQVPNFWYLEGPTDVVPPQTASSSPASDVSARGTRRFVSLQQVIAVEGPRVPAWPDAQRHFRVAVALLALPGEDPTPGQIEKVALAQRRLARFFARKTGNAGAVIPGLGAVVFVDAAHQGFENGTRGFPFDRVVEGRDAAPSGGTLAIQAGSYPENLTFTKPATLRSTLGEAVIGVR